MRFLCFQLTWQKLSYYWRKHVSRPEEMISSCMQLKYIQLIFIFYVCGLNVYLQGEVGVYMNAIGDIQ